MPSHDSGYHLLFSHPAMVEDLLRSFVGEPWVDELDFSTLQRVNYKLHDEFLDRRDGDVLYRARLRGGQEVYLYVLLEFQSTPDPFMVVRVGAYVFGLYLHLIREKRLEGGLLPPVFPVVLYNGGRPWRAPTSLKGLLPPTLSAELLKWQPCVHYHLIDEHREDPARLGEEKSLNAALFRLERCRDPEEMLRIAQQVGELLQGEAFRELRRAFRTWLLEATARKTEGFSPSQVENLGEWRTMLYETARRWEREWLEKGKQEGRQEGRQEGQLEGARQTLLRLIRRRLGEDAQTRLQPLVRLLSSEDSLLDAADWALDAPDEADLAERLREALEGQRS
jgi:predicted transposase/invertase (TIGR01784 family)